MSGSAVALTPADLGPVVSSYFVLPASFLTSLLELGQICQFFPDEASIHQAPIELGHFHQSPTPLSATMFRQTRDTVAASMIWFGISGFLHSSASPSSWRVLASLLLVARVCA